MSDLRINVVDTDDGRKQLTIAVDLDDAEAVQVADLLTRPPEEATVQVQAQVRQRIAAKKTTAKKTTARRGGRR